MKLQFTQDFSTILLGLVFVGSISCKSDVKPVTTKTGGEMTPAKQVVSPETTAQADDNKTTNIAKTKVNSSAEDQTLKEVVTTAKPVEIPESIGANSTPQKPAQAKSQSKATPKIVFDKIRHDFGEITQGDTVDYNFVFRNDGYAPLVINSCKVTCGCTQPSYPFIPIEKGEEGYIGVRYVSVGKEGMQKPLITVFTNASKEPITLMMSGKVTLPTDDKKNVEEQPIDSTKISTIKDTLSESK